MKIVLLYSGGLDSTALLYWLRSRGDEVLPLLVRYGQRHAKELEAGHAILAGLGLRGTQVGVEGLSAPGCCLLDRAAEVPRGVRFDDPDGQRLAWGPVAIHWWRR